MTKIPKKEIQAVLKGWPDMKFNLDYPWLVLRDGLDEVIQAAKADPDRVAELLAPVAKEIIFLANPMIGWNKNDVPAFAEIAKTQNRPEMGFVDNIDDFRAAIGVARIRATIAAQDPDGLSILDGAPSYIPNNED